jgi:nucleotide-binding universal stress UspA family protein
VYAGAEAPKSVLALTGELAAHVDGRTTRLMVASEAERSDAVRAAAIDQARAAGLTGIETRVRVGNGYEQLRIEQAEQVYDFTVLPGSEPGYNPSRLSRMAIALLDHLRNPLLIVKGDRTALRRLLVCTAAGEPGKADVTAAGRLARRLGAAVSLVYVVPVGSSVPERARVHLQQAERELHALDVPVAVKVREAPTPARGILEEAKSGDHDLIVLGEHQPPVRWLRRPTNVALQVCAAADRSVLVLKDELE